MLKMEKEYNQLYGDIPQDSLDRLDFMLKDMNLSRYKLKVYDVIHKIMNIKYLNILSLSFFFLEYYDVYVIHYLPYFLKHYSLR